MAKTFNTDRVRFLRFWRIADQAPYRTGMNMKKLRGAAEKAAKGKT